MVGKRSRTMMVGGVGLAVIAMVMLIGLNAQAQEGQQADQAEVGKPAPQFTLQDTTGKTWSLAELTKQEKVVVLEWFNHECPYVQKHYTQRSQMNDTAQQYSGNGVVWLAVNSSSHHNAEDNAEVKEKWNINHPILVDQSGEVGKKYGARTTPHMYVINKEGTLVYEGAIDNEPSSRASKNGDEYTNYVQHALSGLLNGGEINPKETRPYGCSVKYGDSN